MNRYINTFHNKQYQGSVPVVEHDLKPYIEHNGYTVFKLFDKAFDVVFDGILITQRCGCSIGLLDSIDAGNDIHTPSPRAAQQAKP